MQPTKGKNALLQDRQLDPLGATRTYLSTHTKVVKPVLTYERKTVVYDSDEDQSKNNSMMRIAGVASNVVGKRPVMQTMLPATKPTLASGNRVTHSVGIPSSTNIRLQKATNPLISTSSANSEVVIKPSNGDTQSSISNIHNSSRPKAAINPFLSTCSKSSEVSNQASNGDKQSSSSRIPTASSDNKSHKAINPFLSSLKSHEGSNTPNNENEVCNKGNDGVSDPSTDNGNNNATIEGNDGVSDPSTDNGNNNATIKVPQEYVVENRAELFAAGLKKESHVMLPAEPVGGDKPTYLPSKITTTTGANNENFVRRNLSKNHSDNSRYASMKRKQEKIASRIANREEDGSGADTISDSDEVESTEEKRKPTKEVPGSIGIDPLDLCINYLQPTNNNGITNKNIEMITLSRHVDVRQASIAPAKAVRGLDVQPSKRRKPSTREKEMPEELLQEIAPKCNGHNFPAKLRKVKKAGSKNKGRKFYCCSYPMEDRCNFFMWYDDNPAMISINVAQMKQKEELLKGLSPAEKWCQNALDAYLHRLDLMTLHELKNEVRVCNRVIQSSKHKYKKNMKVSGTKAELMSSLTGHAKVTLQHSYNQVGVQSTIGNDAVDASKKALPAATTAPRPANTDTINLSSSDESCDESIDVGSESESEIASGDIEGEDRDEGSDVKKMKKKDAVDSDDDDLLSPEEHILNLCFGFKHYREGQMWAIERTINGSNSLILMPTGSGKSICYIIPAIMMPGITIVVSPLIALMQDQLNKLPMQLPGALFGGRMSTYEVSKITTSLLAGYIKLLYVSPERLCTSSFRHLIKLLHQSKGPTAVSLLCVDEAHCISQWSYNFRPAFLRIRKEIEYIRPSSILAMTATATPSIKREIVSHLRIRDDGVYSIPSRRENLQLFAVKVDMEEDRKKAILNILYGESGAEGHGDDHARKRGRNKTTPNTIIYVAYKYETEVLSEFLRGHSISAAAYHGGMDSDERAKVYSQFDSGTVRVIVATVAFGMGVDKADVRQIIHSCLPKTVENYLQEIGRAGRDGEAAMCHLIYRKEDAIDSLSLANSTRTSLLQILGLGKCIFKPRSINNSMGKYVLQHYIALPLTRCSTTCDITESMVETVLSILEMQPFNLINVEGTFMSQVKGTFKYDCTKHKDVSSSAIVSAMVKCNTCGHKRNEPSVSDDVSFFDDDYKNTSAQSGHSSNSSGSYKLQAFDCSIEDICNETGLERNQVTKVLYSLQSNGILSYTLCNPAVFISTSTCKHMEFDSLQDVYTWITAVATKILDKSNTMELLNKQRILDMWKIARVISGEQAETSGASGVENDNPGLRMEDTHQNTMMSFLCHYLDYLSDSGQHQAHLSESKEVAAVTAIFNTLSSPNSPIDEKIITAIQRDAQYVANDNRVIALVDDVVREVKMFSASCAYDQEMIALRSVYISKIFHGVSTVKLLTSDWKGSCQQWGSYRRIDFDQLLQHVRSALSEVA